MKQYTYVYVPEGMADWEVGLIAAELNTGRFFRERGSSLPVRTFGLRHAAVTTMAGFHVMPDMALDEVEMKSAALLVLPGGSTWRDAQHGPVLQQAQEFLKADVLVTAICGATEAMAQAGMLDHRPHTSNSLEYLKMAFPGYHGEAFYEQRNVVIDGNLITANNTASVEFAYSILQKLHVFSDMTLAAWKQRFDTHDPKYIMEIMQSLPKV